MPCRVREGESRPAGLGRGNMPHRIREGKHPLEG